MKLDKSKKYVFAVSGGPDSMALLDMGVKEGYTFVVCHVNYHKRDNSYYEMLGVQEYCKKNNIDCYVLNENYSYKGNFQSFARNYRYDFFIKVVNENNLDGIVCAHQKDDLIETYLMQKAKNLDVSYFGLNYESSYKGIKVFRPLLDFSKKDLIEYCEANNVRYFIDESNLSKDYTRNKFRHEVLSCMSEDEMNNIIEEIKSLNEKKKNIFNVVVKLIDNKLFEIEKYNNLDVEEKFMFLRLWLNKHVGNMKYSKKFIEEMDVIIKSNKNSELKLGNYKFVKSYKVCEIVGITDKTYSFVIKSNSLVQNEFFKVLTNGRKIDGISVKDDEWPLTIRNYQEGDSIKLRFGTKKLNRWFIDKKLPVHIRKTWPVVLNNKNEIIMVPGIGADIYHSTIKPTIFVVKC